MPFWSQLTLSLSGLKEDLDAAVGGVGGDDPAAAHHGHVADDGLGPVGLGPGGEAVHQSARDVPGAAPDGRRAVRLPVPWHRQPHGRPGAVGGRRYPFIGKQANHQVSRFGLAVRR